MSGMPGTKRAAEQDPEPFNHGISGGGSGGGESGGGGGGGDDGGGGLYGITAAQKAFLFLDGPADVLRAATACRRWRELACAGSVWRAKAEREGILDKAAAFEVEAPAVAEGGLLENEGTASLAFYARVFVMEVRGRLPRGGGRGAGGGRIHLTTAPPAAPPRPSHCAGVQDEGRGL